MVIKLPLPELTTEAEDIRAIIGYLGLAQSSSEIQQITGLAKSAISEVLSGQRTRDTSKRRHIAIVAAVVRRLSQGRRAATGSNARGQSAVGWLHTAPVATSQGRLTPLQVLADTELAKEALLELTR